MKNSQVKISEKTLENTLDEASWLLSHAEALADYGRNEEAAAELARAANCEEQVEMKSPNMLSEQVELYKAGANRLIQADTRSALGQFMTPAPVASFMASLFRKTKINVVHLLDPGAGVGSLTAAFVENLCKRTCCLSQLNLSGYVFSTIQWPYSGECIGFENASLSR